MTATTTPTTTLAVSATRPPDRNRFRTALDNVGKPRPRVSCDTWDECDAAQFWLHEYDPSDAARVPPQVITGIVARAFTRLYRKVPPMHSFFRNWCDMLADGSAQLARCDAMPHGISLRWQDVVSAVHRGKHPKPPSNTVSYFTEEQTRDTGVNSICDACYGYCHRKTCKYRDSWLNGCLPLHEFRKAVQSGYLVPWNGVRWLGLATVFTPLRHAYGEPSLTVRFDRSHKRYQYIPYWVADFFENANRIFPRLLLAPSFRNEIDQPMRRCVEAVFSERFRFSAMNAMAGDYETRMRAWDRMISAAAWDFPAQDSPYKRVAEGHDCIFCDAETLEQLDATCPSTEVLFGSAGVPHKAT